MLQKAILLHGTEKDGVVSVIMFCVSVSIGLNGYPSPDIKSKSAVVRGKSKNLNRSENETTTATTFYRVIVYIKCSPLNFMTHII